MPVEFVSLAARVVPERERLLDAAANLLARSGYAAASLEEAARLAGVSPLAVRAMFAGKEDLFLSVLDRIAEECLGHLAVLGQPGRPAPIRLQQILVSRVLFRYDRYRVLAPGFSELLTALRPAYLSRSLGHLEREAQLLEQTICEGLQARTLARVGDSFSTSRTLIMATNSLLPHCLRQRDWNDREALETNAYSLARLLVRSIVRLRKPTLTRLSSR